MPRETGFQALRGEHATFACEGRISHFSSVAATGRVFLCDREQEINFKIYNFDFPTPVSLRLPSFFFFNVQRKNTTKFYIIFDCETEQFLDFGYPKKKKKKTKNAKNSKKIYTNKKVKISEVHEMENEKPVCIFSG